MMSKSTKSTKPSAEQPRGYLFSVLLWFATFHVQKYLEYLFQMTEIASDEAADPRLDILRQLYYLFSIICNSRCFSLSSK